MTRVIVVCLWTLLAGCGGGVPDTDEDGIPDSADWCSTVVEEPNGFEDDDGCPDTPPSEPPVPLSLHLLGNWYGEGTVKVVGRQDLVFGSRSQRVGGANAEIPGVRTIDALIIPPCVGGERHALSVYTTGSGNRMLADDISLTCPTFGPIACPRILRYSAISVVLADDASSLQMSGAGTFSDCTATDVPMSVTFHAPAALRFP